jgi:hypothetical protein
VPAPCRRDAILKAAPFGVPATATSHVAPPARITHLVRRILLTLVLLVMPREPSLDLPEASVSTVCQHLAYNAAVAVTLVVADLDRLAINQP